MLFLFNLVPNVNFKTMKTWPLCLIILIAIACNKPSNSEESDAAHIELHRDMERASEEMRKFEGQLSRLYVEAEKDPESAMAKADSLLELNKKETDKYKLQIKRSITDYLNFFRAELYYRGGNYNSSLKILLDKDRNTYGFINGDDALAIAANYTRLKEHDKAKSFVDSIGKGWYIYDYALGNYYETIGDKKEALKVYYDIQKDKEIKHYAYYPLAVARINELEKSDANLLQEIYYPTGNPAFDIADSDNENRDRIFDMVMSMPECKNYGVHIFQSPQTNDKDYYWIKVSNVDHDYVNSDKDYKAKYNFFIYPKNFEIKYYDVETGKLLSLEEWRKTLKH